MPYGFSRCEVKIDSADGFTADDLRRFAVERSDPQNVLLIHNYGDSRSPLYVGAALSAAAQSAFTLESINVTEAAALAESVLASRHRGTQREEQ